ncbi:MAG: prolipoprotein diacylglyceryl transferase [Caldilineales bacterium]|nr:prolipoprotein diacylglyceryl transferase [Caldilineales bacterium]MCW5857637.1 prolipoprotein diacylglyceryl transferase [Caldilineales bacterium]
MNPVAFSIGPLQVHWYGILIVAGAVLGAFVAGSLAKRAGQNPEHIWNMLTVILLLGILGARLYHVFSQPAGEFTGWSYYRQHPIEIIAFWNGGFRGLGIFGGVIGGMLGLFLYTHFAKLRFLEWADYAAPGLLLAQSIGRWGNYINQELYGPPTTLPWGITIDCQHRFGNFHCPPKGDVPAGTHFHPTFLYESLWNFAGFLLLYWISRRFHDRLRQGDVIFLYLIIYPVGRFWIELLFRPDAWTIGALPTASIFSLIAIAIGIAGLVVNHTIRSKPQPAAKAARGKR